MSPCRRSEKAPRKPGGSRRHVVHGDAGRVKDRLRQLPSFGADELLAMPILPPGDEHAFGRTVSTLGELAAE
jgi:hypothetical protein